MDPLTHLLTKRLVLGRDRSALLASVAPDALFYLAYPPWLVKNGLLREALHTGVWPEPPYWLLHAHRATHSLLVALVAASVMRRVRGRWPRGVLLAWLLHILIDVPAHRREPWGPRLLWPVSDVTWDGWSWADALSEWYVRRRRGRRVI
jgi:membrane-bound metal-dependent hydrolase YbcI (DUF457 family)